MQSVNNQEVAIETSLVVHVYTKFEFTFLIHACIACAYQRARALSHCWQLYVTSLKIVQLSAWPGYMIRHACHSVYKSNELLHLLSFIRLRFGMLGSLVRATSYFEFKCTTIRSAKYNWTQWILVCHVPSSTGTCTTIHF